MKYHVPCECGAAVPVELFQAGTDVRCERCQRSLVVPNSLALRELANERHPHLSASERVAAALEEQTPPFDGSCQRCGDRLASVQRVVSFRYLTERIVSDDDGPQIGPLGLTLRVGKAEELWETLQFPLLFCNTCEDEFRRNWRASRWRQWGWSLLLAVLGVPLLVVAFLSVVAIPLLGGILALFFCVLFGKAWGNRKRSTYVQNVLQAIPLVGEAVQQQHEYQLQIGPPQSDWRTGATCGSFGPPVS